MLENLRYMTFLNTHFKTHPLIYFHIVAMLYTFFSAFGGWASALPARTTTLSLHQIAVLNNSFNGRFIKSHLTEQSSTFWSLSRWRMSTKGAMDGRPWAHWNGNWQEDKEATKLWHASLLRLSLNLMAPVWCIVIFVWLHLFHWSLSLLKKRWREKMYLPWHARDASTFSTVRGRVPLTLPVERSNWFK